MIDLKAQGFEEMAEGKEVTQPVSDKDWDSVVKFVEKISSFENYERIVGAEKLSEDDLEPGSGNMFENISKKVQLNGQKPDKSATV